MARYVYPQNLTAKPNIWLWGMRDFVIFALMLLLSVVAFVTLGWIAPAAMALCFGFLTIRLEELTLLQYIRYALCYLWAAQQYYEWR